MKALIGTGCLLLVWVGSAASASDDVSQSEPTKSCREEVWRVYTSTPGGPKVAWMPRSQIRTVLICNKEVFAQIQKQVSSLASDREKQ